MIIILGRDRYRIKLIRIEAEIEALESHTSGKLTDYGLNCLVELKADRAELRAILGLSAKEASK